MDIRLEEILGCSSHGIILNEFVYINFLETGQIDLVITYDE